MDNRKNIWQHKVNNVHSGLTLIVIYHALWYIFILLQAFFSQKINTSQTNRISIIHLSTHNTRSANISMRLCTKQLSKHIHHFGQTDFSLTITHCRMYIIYIYIYRAKLICKKGHSIDHILFLSLCLRWYAIKYIYVEWCCDDLIWATNGLTIYILSKRNTQVDAWRNGRIYSLTKPSSSFSLFDGSHHKNRTRLCRATHEAISRQTAQHIFIYTL